MSEEIADVPSRTEEPQDIKECTFPVQAMSLRDYLAGQAIIGMWQWADSEEIAATAAYKIADAMIATSKKINL